MTVEGCACEGDHLIDDYGDCVALSKCTCYDDYEEGSNKIKEANEISYRACANW